MKKKFNLLKKLSLFFKTSTRVGESGDVAFVAALPLLLPASRLAPLRRRRREKKKSWKDTGRASPPRALRGGAPISPSTRSFWKVGEAASSGVVADFVVGVVGAAAAVASEASCSPRPCRFR